MTVQLTVTFFFFSLWKIRTLSPFTSRRKNFANNLAPSTVGRPHFYITIVVDQQNFVKLNNCSTFNILNVVNKNNFAFFGFKLPWPLISTITTSVFFNYTGYLPGWMLFRFRLIYPLQNSDCKVVQVCKTNKLCQTFFTTFVRVKH